MGSSDRTGGSAGGRAPLVLLLGVAAALLFAPPASARNGAIAVVAAARPMSIGLLAGGTVQPLFETRFDDSYLAHPSFSPDGRRIVFSAGAGSPRTSLAVLSIGGGRPRGVPSGGISARNPSYLADGRIVFSGSRYPSGAHPGTFVVAENGAHRHRLFAREQLTAAASGRWFVATDRRENFHTLFLLDRRGRAIRRLTDDPAYRYLNPRFSPDGRWIVYERENERNGLPHRSDVYLVRRDGTHRRRLTFDRNSAAPTFSPDGRLVAFTRANNGLGGNLFAVSVEHPRRRRLLTRTGGTACREPVWGPRG